MRTYKRTLPSGKITWCYDVWIDGKRKRKSGFSKEREAKEAAKELITEVSKGLDISKESTFKDFYRQWVTVNKKGKITESSFKNYIYALNQFITHFGEDKKLATLSRMEYQGFINWYGETHTQESVRKVNNCLKSALNSAQYDGYIIRNPSYNVSLKDVGKIPAKSEEVKFVSKAEFTKLKEFFKSKNSKSALLLYILAITGARFSEINNLQYIDIKSNCIHIRGGKTDNAKRDINIPTKDIEHIRSVLSHHPTKIQGDIFKLSHNAVTKQLNKGLAHCNIEKNITIHAIRHSHCSVLLGDGVSVNYVSKRLGHASIAITQQVYAHLLEEQFEAEDKHTIDLLNSI